MKGPTRPTQPTASSWSPYRFGRDKASTVAELYFFVGNRIFLCSWPSSTGTGFFFFFSFFWVLNAANLGYTALLLAWGNRHGPVQKMQFKLVLPRESPSALSHGLILTWTGSKCTVPNSTVDNMPHHPFYSSITDRASSTVHMLRDLP